MVAILGGGEATRKVWRNYRGMGRRRGGAPYKVLLLKEKLTEIYFAAGHQEKPKGPGATVVGPVN